jgi:hypothetical protein
MATEDFLSCLSRNALEAAAETAGVPGRIKVKDTRVALVEHFGMLIALIEDGDHDLIPSLARIQRHRRGATCGGSRSRRHH